MTYGFRNQELTRCWTWQRSAAVVYGKRRSYIMNMMNFQGDINSIEAERTA